MTDKPLTNQEIEEGLALHEKAKEPRGIPTTDELRAEEWGLAYNRVEAAWQSAQDRFHEVALNLLPRALRELQALRAELEASPIRRILRKKKP